MIIKELYRLLDVLYILFVKIDRLLNNLYYRIVIKIIVLPLQR